MPHTPHPGGVASPGAHACRSTHRLALLSEEIVRSWDCPTCHDSEAELQDWLAVLGHTGRLAANEYVTRHRLFFQLFDRASTHEDRLGLARNDDLFHHYGLCGLLLQSADEAQCAPRLRGQMLELAMILAPRLPDENYSDQAIRRLRHGLQRRLDGAENG